MDVESPFLARFEDIGETDVTRVGRKNARLGALLRAVGPLGVAIPPGFVVTTDAFDAFVKFNALGAVIAHALRPNGAGPRQTAETLQAAFLRSTIPPTVAAPVLAAYRRLGTLGIERVAVRLSGPEAHREASLGGARLHVVGEAALLDALRSCFASRFHVSYLRRWSDQSAEPSASPVALCVQQMVRSDLGAAGTLSWSLSSLPEAYDVAITASWGLGGRVDSGGIEPDAFLMRVPRRASDMTPSIVTMRRGSKLFKIVYDPEVGDQRCVPTTGEEQQRDVLTAAAQATLARWGVLIAQRCPTVAQVDWAQDGRTGELFVMEARPCLTPERAAFWKRAGVAVSA